MQVSVLGKLLFLGNLVIKVESEEKRLVVDIRATDICFGYLCSFKYLRKTYDAAEGGLEIEAVAFLGFKIYLALASFNSLYKVFNIEIVDIQFSHVVVFLSVNCGVCLSFGLFYIIDFKKSTV